MNRSQKPFGFTLIELLVVIAIIAILAAILFLVFAQAREKARQITCLSNEKQMGIAMLGYVHDYDETYPFCQYRNGTNDLIQWSAVIYPYVKNGDTQKSASGALQAYGQGGIYHCPSFPSDQSYGVNNMICPDGTDPSQQRGTTLAVIDAPADKVLIAEKGQGANTYGYPFFETRVWAWGQGGLDQDRDEQIDPTNNTNPGYPGPECMPRYRHHAHCNMLFTDGHAKSIQRGSVDWAKNIHVPGANNASFQ